MSALSAIEPRHLSDTVANIQVSAIKEMAMLSAQTPGAVSLAWGLPSFRTPEHIREAVRQALNDDPDVGKYALPDGLPELRELVAKQHFERTGTNVDASQQVVITAGNMQGLNAVFHALIDPGDEVLVTDPGFASHLQQIRLCGGVAVPWALDEAAGWTLDVSMLPRLITDRTKAILLVNPSNPTGTLFRESQLREVARIVVERDLVLLVDDPYSHFTYENRKHFFNVARLGSITNHLFYLFTFSKAYAMSGWRLGYMIMPAHWKRHILKVHDATIICAPRVSQAAGIAALGQTPTHLTTFERVLSERRKLICERLDRLSHVFDYVRPQGAYYVFPRVLATQLNSTEFALQLLQQAGVTVTPGRAFGKLGEHHVRMAYCNDEATINLAFDRMESYFNKC